MSTRRLSVSRDWCMHLSDMRYFCDRMASYSNVIVHAVRGEFGSVIGCTLRSVHTPCEEWEED